MFYRTGLDDDYAKNLSNSETAFYDFSETEVENGMTYQIQNQRNISTEEQHIKTRLIAAKNYLEQQDGTQIINYDKGEK